MSLLYSKEIKIANGITLKNPTLREIIGSDDNVFDSNKECLADEYYGLAYFITATPDGMKVQLDDIGIDYSQISEWQLFLMLFDEIRKKDTRLFFGNLDLNKFVLATEKTNEITNDDNLLLVNSDDETIIINKNIYQLITHYMRILLCTSKVNKKPAGEETRKYLIKRARLEQQRALRKNKNTNKGLSQIEEIIVALVNTEEFKYDYNSVLDMNLLQFNLSLKQIAHKINYNNIMIGCYTGNISMEKLSEKELSWFYK